MFKLLEFMEKLVSKNIFNTDLKPENIDLDREFYLFIKLVDVGNCNFNYETIKAYTPFYFN